MKDIRAFLDMRKYRNWVNKISSWKYPTIGRPLLPIFFRAESVSFLLSTLNSFQDVLEVSSCSSTWFNPHRGRWKVSICSWQYVYVWIYICMAYVWHFLYLSMLLPRLAHKRALYLIGLKKVKCLYKLNSQKYNKN